MVSGSGICWAICKSAPHPRQPRQHSTTQFLQARCPSCRPTNSVKALKEYKYKRYFTELAENSKKSVKMMHKAHELYDGQDIVNGNDKMNHVHSNAKINVMFGTELHSAASVISRTFEVIGGRT